jgi:hypothetical protein
LPEITLVLASEVSGAHFELDGNPVAAALLGKAVPINPGTHALEVRASGYHPHIAQVTVAEGERRTVTVELKLAPSGQPSVRSS